MRTLQITGWREGLKISMNDVLREHLSLSLSESKATVDSILPLKTGIG